jgi:hypothetical protein
MRAGSVRVSDWIEGLERWPAPRIAAVVIVLVGAPLVLAVAPFTAAAADFGLVVLALAAAGGGAGLWRRKQLKAALPLELSRVGLAGHVNGAPVVRFRARLGHGRAMRAPVAVVTFEPVGGPPVPVATLRAAAPVLVGPWTLVVPDPGRADGAFVVRVTASEGPREWSTEARYPVAELGRGWFCGGVARRGGRLVFDAGAWEQRQAEDA